MIISGGLFAHIVGLRVYYITVDCHKDIFNIYLKYRVLKSIK